MNTRRNLIIALPVNLLLFIMLALILAFTFFLAFIGFTALAFRKLGLPWIVAFTLLWLSLIGSPINIPVGELTSEVEIERTRYIVFFGIAYPVPCVERVKRKTIVAVNLGGCVIPLLVSLFIVLRLLLIGQVLLLFKALVCTLVASLIFYHVARPVRGLGVVMPLLVPPLVSAIIALLVAPENPAPVAYLTGTIGTLIGADLLNLPKVKKLGAGVVSIGGAGTFDGIFLTGILATLFV